MHLLKVMLKASGKKGGFPTGIVWIFASSVAIFTVDDLALGGMHLQPALHEPNLKIGP